MGQTTLPCPRCGTLRIVEKTWVEDFETSAGISKVTHTRMVCPNTECQAKVDNDVAKLEQKRAAAQQAKEERYQRSTGRAATS